MLYECAFNFITCLMDLSRLVSQYPSLKLTTLLLIMLIVSCYLINKTQKIGRDILRYTQHQNKKQIN